MDYEYKCVGAPERPRRSRRARTPSDRVATAMEKIIQDEAVNGWEYMRTDLVPVVEKSSFLGRAQEVHRAVLVFRRDLESRSGRAVERPRRQDVSTDLFGDTPMRRRQPRERQEIADTPPQPVAAPEPVRGPAHGTARPAAPEPAPGTVGDRPLRARAVPAEEPIRLTADDLAEPPPVRPRRDRLPPSGLG